MPAEARLFWLPRLQRAHSPVREPATDPCSRQVREAFLNFLRQVMPGHFAAMHSARNGTDCEPVQHANISRLSLHINQRRHIPRAMRRLFALIWLALCLAMASGPAFAVPAADCPMAGSSKGMHPDKDRNCCKPACAPNCAMPCPNVVMPSADVAAGPAELIRPLLVTSLAAALQSFDLSGADPPPKTIIS